MIGQKKSLYWYAPIIQKNRKPVRIKTIALYLFFKINARINNGKKMKLSYRANGINEIAIADAIYLSLKNNQTAKTRTNPHKISVRAVNSIIQYNGVKMTKISTSHGTGNFNRFTRRNVR